MNPYKVLGVRKNASAESIKLSYRWRSLEVHPDRNPGDEKATERFNEVNRAYRVLSDPARRKKYDETGQIDEDVPDKTKGEVLLMLTPALGASINELLEKGQKVEQHDLVGMMKDWLRKFIQAQDKAIAQVAPAQAMLTESLKRLVENPESQGEPLVTLGIRQQLDFAGKQLAQAQHHKEIAEQAMAYLKCCSFCFTAPQPCSFSGTTTSFIRMFGG